MPRIQSQTRSRHRALWTLLRWEGELRNSRVRELVGLAKVQTSRLLVGFAQTYPQAVIQDDSDKSWRLNREAQAAKEGGPLEEYLALCGHAGGTPTIMDARVDFVEPAPKLISLLAKAARERRGVRVFYRSMSSPAGRERLLFPRAVVRLSQRWHVRAWCSERREYRDFNLGRMEKPALTSELLPKEAGIDKAWVSLVSVRIGIHEALKGDVSKMLRQEFFQGAASMRLEVRGALLQYALQQARVAINPAEEKPPSFLLQALDPKVLKLYLFSGRLD